MKYSDLVPALRVLFVFHVLSALACGGAEAASAVARSRVEGYWVGAIRHGPVLEQSVAIDIASATPDKLDAAMRSLDPVNQRFPITLLAEREGGVHFEVPSMHGTFDGKLSADNAKMVGEWRQGDRGLPVVLNRVAAPATVNRPQEPKKPYPYAEEEVVVSNAPAGVRLAGTLTLPSTPGRHPAVVLVTGSGPHNRDEAGSGHRPFLVLADYLTRQGIAVLRCDDRGVGGSTGNFATALDADFAEDALAGVAFLRTRPEIDPRRIGIVGHSEGGVVAPRAAAKSADVAFVVLLAGVGVPMDELLQRQSRDLAAMLGASESFLSWNVAALRDVFALLRTKKDATELEGDLRQLVVDRLRAVTAEERKTVGYTDAYLDRQLRMLRSPWFRDLLSYDPRATLRTLKCPVLAICGEKDLQVSAKENLSAIAAALTSGGNTRVTTLELPGLNHCFQSCQTGSPLEYSRIEETFDPNAMKLIAEWITEASRAGE